MTILYIDIERRYSNIRPAERIIFGREFRKFRNNVIFLLIANCRKTMDIVEDNLVYYRNSRSFWKFGLDIFSTLVSAQRIIRTFDVDIVVVRNDIDSGLAARLLSYFYKIPFVFIRAFPTEDMLLYLLQTQSPANSLKYFFRKLRILINKRILLLLLKHADLVIPRAELFANYLGIQGISYERMYVLPMGFDQSLDIVDIDCSSIMKEHNLEGYSRIVYIGSMDKLRNLEFVIRAVSILSRTMEKVKLIMVGGKDSEIEYLREVAHKEGIDDKLLFVGSVSHKDVPRYLRLGHISVSLIPPLPFYEISSPTKVVESLGVGVPVLVNNEIHDQKSVVEASGGGLTIGYLSEHEAAEALESLLKDKEALQIMGRRGREYVLKHRTYEKLATELNEALLKLVRSSNHDN